MRSIARLGLLLTVVATGSAGAGPHVQVAVHEASRRVEITVDGKPFTAYVWPMSLKKPVLYPIRTAAGTPVTRGFPLEPRPGERVDHPHHVGLWFNHGDVNGFDFWNNSENIPVERAPRMGTIHHRRVLEARDGDGRGELVVESEWMDAAGRPLIRERTRFVFRAAGRVRRIDRIATLTAVEPVHIRDNKEGTLGLRVARALEQPGETDSAGVTGQYKSSEGKVGDAVWGTRGRWALLSGRLGAEPVTIAILDHPSNPGYPTHWHARGYGLFAANPLGQKALNDGDIELNLDLARGASATFRYRVLILGAPADAARVEREWQAFARETL